MTQLGAEKPQLGLENWDRGREGAVGQVEEEAWSPQ